MKFLDLFKGIGGFRLGLERAGHTCVGSCEIDKFANLSYEAIHYTDGEVEFNDITKVSNEEWSQFRGKVDIIAGGFPCQSFSIAGKREGFADKTKGTLFFEIIRAAQQIKPSYLFLENVKGLINHDKGRTFRTILASLDELGYDAEWQILNSKDFGVPQNRERVFIIGHLRGSGRRKVFPIQGTNGSINQNDLKQVNDSKKVKGFESTSRFYDTEGIAPCLNTMGGGGREPKIMVREATKQGYAVAEVGDSINFDQPNSKTRRGRVGKGIANTLTTSCNQGTLVGRRNVLDTLEEVRILTESKRKNEETEVLLKENGNIRPHRMDAKKSGISELNINYEKNQSHTVTTAHMPKIYGESTNFRIRKLTPRECWRLQGFPDWAFDRASKVVSDSQLYKQAGNSVTVNVIQAIAERLHE